MLLPLLVSWCYFAALTLAAPVEKRIVYDPPITYPTAGEVWRVGEKRTVTWDIANLPNGTGPGMILLGFLTNDSEHLIIDSPLAKGFPLSDAHADVIVPSVPERNDYIVVLFGDSGNASPKFTILGGPAPAPALPSSSSDPTPTTDVDKTPATTAATTMTAAPTAKAPDSTPSIQAQNTESLVPPMPIAKPDPVPDAASHTSSASAASAATTSVKASSASARVSGLRTLSCVSAVVMTLLLIQ